MASTQQDLRGGAIEHAHLHIALDDDADSATIDPARLRPFSRSPHPYHRIGSTTADRREWSPARSEYQVSDSGSIYGAAQTRRNGWARTSPRASSESGTEADDESTGLLKGLPAPPTRSRKGLRNTAGRDDPALWLHHETPTPWSLFVRSPLRSFKRSSSDESIHKLSSTASIAREVVLRRKRNEILRRLAETALLLSVGAVVLLREDVRAHAHSWRKELCTCFSTVITLYALYPLRLSAGRRGPRFTFTFSIPSSFDPAPLLYPILVPVFVALSTLHHRPALILPNIVLSLSSIPPQVIPQHTLHHGRLSVAHWAFTTIPVVLSEHDITYLSTRSIPLSLRGLNSEVLLLLYPLHQALVSTLDFLLATSLLPAELHLLGAGLINLFLFANSPQAQILKALLWLGGLSVWVLCRAVFRWEITLARIPTWKFRRPPSSSFSPKKLINFIDHKICEKIGALGTSSEKEPDADSDDDGSQSTPMKLLPRQRSLPRQNGFFMRRNELLSAAEGIRLDDLWPSSWAATKQFLSSHRRRHTISTVDDLETVSTGRGPRTTPGGRRKRSMAPDMASFLSLTAAQARIRRWLFAGYIFAAVVLIILVPVRRYIANEALHGIDPFGWALGYLFGNLSSFRLWTLKCNLESWISLPERHVEAQFCHLGWVEHLRRDTLGEANTRLFISGYCVLVLIVGMAMVFQLSTIAEVDTRRKVFHGMMVLMFLPITYIDPAYTALALSLVLAIFLLLDLLRASQVPPIAKPLTYFLAPYTDGRDHRGPVIVSHIFLLIGCAIPLWLSLADLRRVDDNGPWSGWEVPSRDVSMVSGIVCVGMGDAAASLVGRRYGRLKWFWGGGKSLEGSLAFTVAVFLGLVVARLWLLVGGWTALSDPALFSSSLPSDTSIIPPAETTAATTSATFLSFWLLVAVKCLFAAAGASLTEAVLTGGNDNVIVPVVLWLLVRGLEI